MISGVTYIIIVSVENYIEISSFPKVDFAKKDAEDLVNAFKLLGYDEDDFIILINEKATRTSVVQKVKKVAERALENDRIIFYFSGHGFYESGDNYLAPVDAIRTAIPDTCVSISEILGHFKKSSSKRTILFLDCCHSGFEAGKYIREGENLFMADELIFQFRREEFCTGFASCKSNQKSISHPELQNGVWTHFLIKALIGEASDIYIKGLLFSDKLQSYLNKKTYEYVKMNTLTKREQTPIRFGSETDKFIIADVNPIFEEKERNRKVSDLSFTNISLLNEESDSVKNLPGFQKGFHKVPSYMGPAPDNFIKEKGTQIIKEEIETLSENLKTSLRYKRNEIRPSTDLGVGSIETPDFDYSISISQSESDPGEYIVTRRLDNFKNSDIVSRPEFNSVFSNHFDNLVFELSNKVSITKLIDTIETLEDDSPIKVHYNPANLKTCTISIQGLKNEIVVTNSTLSITR